MAARKRPYRQDCPRCGVAFEPLRPGQKYCSKGCARNVWSRQDVRDLENMLAGGETPADIGKILNRSTGAVGIKAHRRGCRNSRGPGRPPDVYKRATVIDLLYKGLTLSQIGRLLGVSPNTVRKMVVSLVKDGTVRKTGTNPTNTRYVPVLKLRENDTGD